MTIATKTVGNAIPTNAFDYSAISPEKAEALRAQAQKITCRLKRSTEDMLEIGRELTAVRQQLGAKAFEAWVSSECGITVRAAQLYMRAHEEFEGCEIISQIPPTAVLKLAAPSVPHEVRDKFVKGAAAGEKVTAKEVDEAMSVVRRQRAKTKVGNDEKVAALAGKTDADRQKHKHEAKDRKILKSDAYYRELQASQLSGSQADNRAAGLAAMLDKYLSADEWNKVCELLDDPAVVDRNQNVSGRRSIIAMDKIRKPLMTQILLDEDELADLTLMLGEAA